MSLKKQIIFIFVSITFIAIGISGLFYYQTAKKSLLGQIYNNVEAISESQKQRVASLVAKGQEHIILLQLRDAFTEDFYYFLKNGDQEKKASIERDLEDTRNKIHNYNEIHLVSKEGKVILSSKKNHDGMDMGDRTSFRHALNGEIGLHDIFFDARGNLTYNLAGSLYHEGEGIGVLIINIKADEILEVVRDYTGLGETGETIIAKRLPNGESFLISPPRFPGHHRVMSTISGKK